MIEWGSWPRTLLEDTSGPTSWSLDGLIRNNGHKVAWNKTYFTTSTAASWGHGTEFWPTKR